MDSESRSLRQQARGFALGVHQPDGLFVEGDESICTKPISLVGNRAVGEISARVKHDQAGLGRGAIDDNVRAVEQAPNGTCDIAWPNFIALQHPNQFAKGRYRQRDSISFAESHLGGLALRGIIFGQCSYQNVGVRGDLHRLPAHPRAMIRFISSIERDRPFLFAFREPKTSDILPAGRAALTSIRPSGSLLTEILSPGCTPRCSR